ncbi:MAG TPA: alpha/beta hydrolase [Solirubrobacteraceae bacterium]|nr:alpha/beta hydrolase [Solirubrobacteraceae bacterium]
MATIRLDNGINLAYDDRGPEDARALVLIHGISMSRRYFHKQLAPLSARHRVIAVDLRAHGDSEKVQSGHTVPQYARDIDQFIRHLGLDRPVLLGWSMGVFVALDYIRQFGTDGVGGLIDVDEAASDFKWDGWEHGFLDLPTLHSLMTAVQDDREAFIADFVPDMFHKPPAPEDLEWMVSESSKLPTGPLSAILFDQTVQDYRDVLPAIDVPTLICWGRHDQLLPVSGAPYMHEHIRDSRLEVFEDSGHCPFLEEAERFNQVVQAFLDTL